MCFTVDNGLIPCDLHGISSLDKCDTFSQYLFKRILTKINRKSAGGRNGLPHIFLISCSKSLCQPLAYLFQLSVVFSYIPPSRDVKSWVPHQRLSTRLFQRGPVSVNCSIHLSLSNVQQQIFISPHILALCH